MGEYVVLDLALNRLRGAPLRMLPNIVADRTLVNGKDCGQAGNYGRKSMTTKPNFTETSKDVRCKLRRL